MEVPTVLTHTRIAVQIAEQIVDTPVPRGRDRRRLQGSLPGQSSTTSLSSGKRISERIMEQIVDFPEQTVEQTVDISPGVGLGQGSSSSAGPADEDFIGGFSHFSQREKSARAAASPSARVPPHSSSWTPAAYQASSGSDEWVLMRTPDFGKSYHWNRRTRLSSWSRAVVYSGFRGRQLCTRLVFMVTMLLALCSLPWSAGPGCSSSWPIWTRRTVVVACSRLVSLVVLHLALFPFPWFEGP